MRKILLFIGALNEELSIDGQTVHSGDEFEVSQERAEELLADPSVNVREAAEPKPEADGGEGSEQ